MPVLKHQQKETEMNVSVLRIGVNILQNKHIVIITEKRGKKCVSEHV